MIKRSNFEALNEKMIFTFFERKLLRLRYSPLFTYEKCLIIQLRGAGRELLLF